MEKFRTIKVQGNGSVSVKPDIAVLSFNVIEDSKEYAESLEKAAKATQVIRENLKSLGVNSLELKTRDFGVQMLTKEKAGKSVFLCFRARHSLRIHLPCEKEALNRVFGKMAETADNTEIRLGFTVSDPEELRKEAIKRAVKAATENATILAEASSLRLAGIADIQYGWTEIRVYQEYDSPMFSRRPGSSFSMDIEPENISTSETVNMVWEIG